jgi:hypothetical protein
MKLAVTPDMLFDSCRVLVLEECRAAEEDMLSLGIIIPDKAWLVLRGRMMSVVVEKAICTIQSNVGGQMGFQSVHEIDPGGSCRVDESDWYWHCDQA